MFKYLRFRLDCIFLISLKRFSDVSCELNIMTLLMISYINNFTKATLKSDIVPILTAPRYQDNESLP